MAAILGFLLVTIIDRVWFRIDYKKAEKGLEVFEHYHYFFPLWIIAFIVFEYVPILSYTLISMGAAFFYHESKQTNFFAHQSIHFRNSSIIGLVLAILTILAYVCIL